MNTPNSPRSGIVPPEVTASRCAPGRPAIVPATRSQTMRGRSSANSSLGYSPLSRSRVASNALRGSVANGALRRTVSNHSSTSSVVEGDGRDRLLGEHVERVRGNGDRLDLARQHPLDRDRRCAAGRCGAWGTARPSRSRPPDVRRGRCAADRMPRSAVTRPESRDRRRPCRCRARANSSRRRSAGGRT